MAPPALPAPPARPGSASHVPAVTARGSATTYYFRYGTTTAYADHTASVNAGSGRTAVHVTARITGLTRHRTYHYRIRAVSSKGQVTGADRTFTTS